MIAHNEQELDAVAQAILAKYADQRIFGFFGEMGAGKTTLIKALCRTLGVVNMPTSPTFALVNEYLCHSGEPVYHFDFYRIEEVDEARQIGFEEYLYSGHYCFIEWTEKVESLLQESYTRVEITVDAMHCRIINLI
ncbi:MAG: tRNA (adenosine(37)-N6)-threonylcarbamoyltransferase complex ATPase subunit type 1 TsaE [Bacteroidales bacterium]|jgi:tRNA threonylcarbamoyladenosine biosynthesis protein TsaE|nr:tRNA (adenosine(37)-N6)-threonylcarbamoyltransferase complex ATPase subunit type 1 TsaE [Bacteroidales bacterium]